MGESLTLSKSQTHNVQCGLPVSDFVQALDQVLDKPDGVMVLGQTPGSSPFAGVIEGNSFRIRKKAEALNPFARELRGTVGIDQSGNTCIDCTFQDVSAGKLFTLLAIVAGVPVTLFFISFLLADDRVAFVYSTGIYIALLAPAAMLIVGIAVWQAGQILAFRCDEELLDCVRRIASGAPPVI